MKKVDQLNLIIRENQEKITSLENKYNKLVDKYNALADKYNKQALMLKVEIDENKSLVAENKSLKKNAIVWYKVEHFDEPDEGGFVVGGTPAEDGKSYFVLSKEKEIIVALLCCDEDGYYFDELYWKDIEAWAEIPKAE